MKRKLRYTISAMLALAAAAAIYFVPSTRVADADPCHVFGRTLCPFCGCYDANRVTDTWNGQKKFWRRSDPAWL